ncbi:MAG TPA: hypothetical protein ENN31_01305 [Candidatus Vogelbacteria bacterium]|mgnify:CR=1 FL=1|nr:hypothetical protein [Candidatus Vogelbacteria bacterium]
MENIDFWLKKIVIFGLLAVPFTLIIVLAGLFFPYIVGKALFFRSIITIIFPLWLILAIRDKRYRPSFSWLLVFLGLFILSLSISSFLAPDSYVSFWSNYERMEGLITMLYLGAYFLILISVFKEEDDWNWWFNLFLGANLYVCLWGILQLVIYSSINPSLIINFRLDSTLGNAIYLAIISLIGIWLATWQLLSSRFDFRKLAISFSIALTLFILGTFWQYNFLIPPQLKVSMEASEILSIVSSWRGIFILFSILIIGFLIWFYRFFENRSDYEKPVVGLIYGLLILINFIVILFTRSRGVQLGLVGSIFLACLLSVIVINKASVRKLFVIFLVVISLLAGGFWLNREAPIISQNPFLSRLATISWSDATTRSRLILWQFSWEGVKERPVFGWGQENFPKVFGKYYDPRMADQEEWFDRSHNVFLDWLIAGGFSGLFLFLSLWFLSLLYLWFSKNFSKTEKIIFTSLLAGYFFQNIFVFDNLTSYLFFFTWLAFVHCRSRSKDKPITDSETSEIFQIITAGIVSIFAVFIFYQVVYLPLEANRLIIKAKTNLSSQPQKSLEYYQRVFSLNTFGSLEAAEHFVLDGLSLSTAENIPLNIRTDFAQASLNRLEEFINLHPGNIRFLHIQGLAYRHYRQFDLSVSSFEKALELSPRKQILMADLVLSLYLAGRSEEAIALMEEVLDNSFGIVKIIDKGINFFAEIKDYQRLSDLWRIRSELEPNDYKARTSYAVSLYASGNKEESLKEIDLIILDFPEKSLELEAVKKQITKDLLQIE